jgi:hypothetical protein
MNRRVWTGTCAAIVSFATAGMLAQTTAQTPAPQQSTPSSSATKVTVVGCLKAAPGIAGDTASAANPSPTGTAGSTETGAPPAAATGTSGASAEPKFVLTDASASPAETATSAQTYRLIANPVSLTEHVGKKLELVGTIDTTSTPDPKDPSAAAPALRVESGKIVAASCQ